MKQLHILNGDASLPAFKLAALPGDIMIWREILSEGPVDATAPETDFWHMRRQYITSTYAETPEAYHQKVHAELLLLEQLGSYAEVVLWFDTDLMCQVNLLYLVQLLAQKQAKAISIATPAQKQVAFLLPGQIQFVYDKRHPLQAEELQLATQLWQAYASPNPAALQQHLSYLHGSFHHLRLALYKHLQRFPSCRNGLSRPEQVLLELLAAGTTQLPGLMQQFWQREPLYGFGDWQILTLLNSLAPELVQHEGQEVALTNAGREVLQQKRKRQTIKPFGNWIGGVYLLGTEPGWCRDSQEKLIHHI